VGDLKELFLPNDVQSSELNMERLWYWEHVAEYLGINADLGKLDGWHISTERRVRNGEGSNGETG
jgi:hypothetical protein